MSELGELSMLQQAVAYQALYGALAPVVKANGDGLRGEVDRELRDIYERTGAKTYAVQADGVKLGTYTVVEAAAVPEHDETAFDLVDREAFARWAAENGELLGEYVASYGEDFARWLAEEHGEVPDGVSVRTRHVGAAPATYKGGTIRVDREFQSRVRDALSDGLAALVDPTLGRIGDGS